MNNLLRRSRGHARDPVTDRSLRHSVRDGMAFAVMTGGGETYMSAFAVFCKASAPQVALLTTLPALLGSFAQLLGALAARRLASRKPVILIGALLQGLTWLPIAALPYLFPEHAVLILLALYTLYFGGANLVAPPWTSLMGDIVPERRRGRFFAHRTRLTSFVTFSALVGAGLILHEFDARNSTHLGFAVIFTVAFAARMVSAYHLGQMHDPPGVHLRSPFEVFGRDTLRLLRRTGAILFSVYFALMQMSVAIAAPFFAVYMLRDLQFSYLEFMLNTGTAILFQFIALNTWGRVSDVFGNRLILLVTGVLVPMLPLLWNVTDSFWYLILVQCLSGVAWGGFSLSTGNLLYELVPPVRRAGYVAFHNILTAVGVFLGAVLGIQLISVVPVRPTLLGDPGHASVLLNLFMVSTAARLLIAILLLKRVRELRRPRRRISARHFVFRVTRFSAFMGLVYDAVAALRPGEN